MENTVKFNETEEVENIEQYDENTLEGSNNAALVAGIIGGFLAYAVVNVGKKIINFAITKIADHKAKKGIKKGVIDADYTDVTEEQEFDENT